MNLGLDGLECVANRISTLFRCEYVDWLAKSVNDSTYCMDCAT